jgi:hypothetical protein
MKILPALTIKLADNGSFPKVEELSWGRDGEGAQSPTVLLVAPALLRLSLATLTPRNRKERRCWRIASPKHRTREASPSYS